MTKEEWRIFIAILVSLCSLVGTMSFLVGRAKGWRDRHNHVDRDNLVVESAIFKPLPDGRIEFAIETLDRLPTLHEVFGNPHVEGIVRKLVGRRKAGEPLFTSGQDHYDAMERVCTFITGPDPAATQSAMFGRHDDYNIDDTAVILTSARGEDGIVMPRILKANPANLLQLEDPAFIAQLAPLRAVHKDYLALLQRMAILYKESQKTFKNCTDEREAGKQAAVWTAIIRTQKTMTLEVVTDVVNASVVRLMKEALATAGTHALSSAGTLRDRLDALPGHSS